MKQVLRVKQVAECLGLSVNSVWKKCNANSHLYDPNFPKPFKISANATGWLQSEINDYIQYKTNQRKAQYEPA